jgi:hypothetical protein
MTILGGDARGISANGNCHRKRFEQWIALVKDLEITAVIGATAPPRASPAEQTLLPWIGLGYGFADPLEYASRTHHSNMDLYDRVQVGDVMQGAAWFITTPRYVQMLPRNPAPT